MHWCIILMNLLFTFTEILGSKKKAYADLARQINCTKSEMDNCKNKIDTLRAQRESQGTL